MARRPTCSGVIVRFAGNRLIYADLASLEHFYVDFGAYLEAKRLVQRYGGPVRRPRMEKWPVSSGFDASRDGG